MHVKELIKKTDFYLIIFISYLLLRMWVEQNLHFDSYTYWDMDMQIAGTLILCIAIYKTYRLGLLLLKILL